MGLIFNRRCSRCGRDRGLCPHTNPNISDTARQRHAELAERKYISSGGHGSSKRKR